MSFIISFLENQINREKTLSIPKEVVYTILVIFNESSQTIIPQKMIVK